MKKFHKNKIPKKNASLFFPQKDLVILNFIYHFIWFFSPFNFSVVWKNFIHNRSLHFVRWGRRKGQWFALGHRSLLGVLPLFFSADEFEERIFCIRHKEASFLRVFSVTLLEKKLSWDKFTTKWKPKMWNSWVQNIVGQIYNKVQSPKCGIPEYRTLFHLVTGSNVGKTFHFDVTQTFWTFFFFPRDNHIPLCPLPPHKVV